MFCCFCMYTAHVYKCAMMIIEKVSVPILALFTRHCILSSRVDELQFMFHCPHQCGGGSGGSGVDAVCSPVAVGVWCVQVKENFQDEQGF